MTEFGIFNDEGCIERGFWTRDEAGAALADFYAAGEENLSIEALCDEHDEQPADSCEACFSDLQECSNCDDEVGALSSRGWCDGCEEEAAS